MSCLLFLLFCSQEVYPMYHFIYSQLLSFSISQISITWSSFPSLRESYKTQGVQSLILQPLWSRTYCYFSRPHLFITFLCIERTLPVMSSNPTTPAAFFAASSSPAAFSLFAPSQDPSEAYQRGAILQSCINRNPLSRVDLKSLGILKSNKKTSKK